MQGTCPGCDEQGKQEKIDPCPPNVPNFAYYIVGLR